MFLALPGIDPSYEQNFFHVFNGTGLWERIKADPIFDDSDFLVIFGLEMLSQPVSSREGIGDDDIGLMGY